ncbi:glutaminase A [Fastidiosipila sanguinis]|uniref:Glutaminase n=1 Tax=Fastidiosipila sanguinis TaxID=236753 RepID=A0A2S0KNY6_9FIRM|nr:glutaminase A [Fastidiosipila sanguinis]AVM42745.1 glutaminase A [Fastidiosipila sanguinis]
MNFNISEFESDITTALNNSRSKLSTGKVVDYIPELSTANPEHLGFMLKTVDNQKFSCGDTDIKFTIQSISKVAALIIAIETFSYDFVFDKVGMEASSAPFTELSTLDTAPHKPNNPFINAGAIVIASMLESKYTIEEAIEIIGKYCSNPNLEIEMDVYNSEVSSNSRNHSLTWELKNLNLLSSTPSKSLEFYTRLCAINLSLEDLTNFATLLANYGKDPETGEQIISAKTVKVVLSIMFTCGLYNGTGSFAVKAGLAAKSGVSGGVIYVKPQEFGIATFGPALDANGNSIGGLDLVEQLSQKYNWHIFSENS